MTASEQPGPRGKQARGVRTRAKLIGATAKVVAEVGYAQATTKAIAAEAGVAEGTIYRHFADKHELYLAAVLEANAELVDVVAQLPERAGTATVPEVLGHALRTLASLRAQLLPIELSLLNQPEARAAIGTAAPDDAAFGPMRPMADYIAAEQAAGRIRPTLHPERTALTLLSTLFGIALLPQSNDEKQYQRLVDEALDVLITGLVLPD
jgi:AcrR family transcriptional regulator